MAQQQVVEADQRPGARLAWVDVAKAVAIVLVVVHHVVVFAGAAGWLPPVVTLLNQQAAAVRMPLFFLASGLFAARALARPWRTVLRKRILFFAYLYLLWTVIRFLLFQVVPDVRANGVDGDLGALLLSPLLPGTGLWFIYALAVFSVVAKVTVQVPVGLQLLLSAVLAAAVGSGLVAVGNFAWRNMAMYYVFFLVGMHLRARVQDFAEHTTPRSVSLLALATALGLVVVHVTGARAVPGVWLLLSSVAVAFGVSLSAHLARGRRLAGWMVPLGQRTLPVYLMHVPWVALAVAVIERGVGPQGPLGVGLVLVLAVAAVAVTVSTYQPFRRVAPWLFALPAR